MRRKRHVQVVFLFVVITGFLFVLYQFFQNKSVLHPLAYLPIPKASRVYLPDPLAFTPFSDRILGAQPIVPDDIIRYVNIERAAVKSPPLKINPILSQAAKLRADTILKHQNFSHQDPYEGIELTTVLPKVKYYYRYATENIGMGGESAENFVYGFMHSTAHKLNLLNPVLIESGAAVVTGQYQQWYVNIAVQLFAVPATREEWLGYSDKDIAYYKQLLDGINGHLSFTQGYLDKRIGDQAYYQGWKELLLRQQAIIGSLYDSMQHEVPWRDEQFALINEYNANWGKAPKV